MTAPSAPTLSSPPATLGSSASSPSDRAVCSIKSVPITRANETFRAFMLSLALVFLATFVLLNVMLHMMVIRRVTRLASIADQVSLGNLDAGDFKSKSRDEIGVLSEALGRMKVSLVQAMRMLE